MSDAVFSSPIGRRGFAKGLGAAFGALVVGGGGGVLGGCVAGGGAADTGGAAGPWARAYRADPLGLLDLIEGFSWRTVSSVGDRMDDGLSVPDRADGMGAFDLGGGRMALVRNHELSPRHVADGPFGGAGGGAGADGLPGGTLPAYDRRRSDGAPLPGGTTTMVLDLASGRLERQHLSLVGTIRNCAGGVTPWGSWLTCEEDLTRAGDGVGRDHGWVFEVPAAATGPVMPVPLTAMGRFNHEAAAVDPRTGIVYLSEDREDGLLYRFLPAVPGRLAAGGRLEALAFADPAIRDTRNWSGRDLTAGAALPVRWLPCEGIDSPDDDLRHRMAAKGAVPFARGEGLHMGPAGELYLAATSGGAARVGQIFRYRPAPAEGGDERAAPGRLELFVESAGTDMLHYADNLTVAPDGHLIVCEDKAGDGTGNRLRIVTPSGAVGDLARLRIDTELAGVCLSPDARTMFVNIYSPARTVAITGPWPWVRG